MNRYTLTLILTMTVLLGSSGACWSADFQKDVDATERGDYATALKEWTPLAKQGDQHNLGVMYEKRQGVPQDDRTTMNKNELGGKIRDSSEKQMTPSQIEQAQTLARERAAKNYNNRSSKIKPLELIGTTLLTLNEKGDMSLSTRQSTTVSWGHVETDELDAFLDLSEHLVNSSDPIFIDSMHLSVNGNRMIAKKIGAFVQP